MSDSEMNVGVLVLQTR